jgi:hypothetical protein
MSWAGRARIEIKDQSERVEDIARGVQVICRSNARFVFGHVSLQSTSRALQPAQRPEGMRTLRLSVARCTVL